MDRACQKKDHSHGSKNKHTRTYEHANNTREPTLWIESPPLVMTLRTLSVNTTGSQIKRYQLLLSNISESFSNNVFFQKDNVVLIDESLLLHHYNNDIV